MFLLLIYRVFAVVKRIHVKIPRLNIPDGLRPGRNIFSNANIDIAI